MRQGNAWVLRHALRPSILDSVTFPFVTGGVLRGVFKGPVVASCILRQPRISSQLPAQFKPSQLINLVESACPWFAEARAKDLCRRVGLPGVLRWPCGMSHVECE
jgi:hypothetical protein